MAVVGRGPGAIPVHVSRLLGLILSLLVIARHVQQLDRAVLVALMEWLTPLCIQPFALCVTRKQARKSVCVPVVPPRLLCTLFYTRTGPVVGSADHRTSATKDFAMLVPLRGSARRVLSRSLLADERLLPRSARHARLRTSALAKAVPVDSAKMLQRIPAPAIVTVKVDLPSEGTVKRVGQHAAMLAVLVLMVLVASIQERGARKSWRMHSQILSASVAPVALKDFEVTRSPSSNTSTCTYTYKHASQYCKDTLFLEAAMWATLTSLD